MGNKKGVIAGSWKAKRICRACEQEFIPAHWNQYICIGCPHRRIYDYSLQDGIHRATYYDRRRAIDAYKVGLGCTDCGYRKDPRALDFDHRDPTQKLFHIGGSLMLAWNRVIAEIRKCDVRCANCHRVKTAEMGEGPYGGPVWAIPELKFNTTP